MGMKIVTTFGALVLVFVSVGLGGYTTSAQVRSSNNYQLQSDSLNFGGGLATSSNYSQESTFGEIATGQSDSSTYSLRAGYQQMQAVYLAMTTPANVVMSNLIGIGGGTSNGSTTVVVTTDSPAGYELSIAAENSPAMQSPTQTITDYAPAGDPDFVFTTDATEAHFGFSPSGPDVVDRFLDNGVDTCNTDSNNTALACWDGLSTTPITIASAATANQPLGASTTIHFRVGLGSNVVQEAGTYVSTTTVTAIAL